MCWGETFSVASWRMSSPQQHTWKLRLSAFLRGMTLHGKYSFLSFLKPWTSSSTWLFLSSDRCEPSLLLQGQPDLFQRVCTHLTHRRAHSELKHLSCSRNSFWVAKVVHWEGKCHSSTADLPNCSDDFWRGKPESLGHCFVPEAENTFTDGLEQLLSQIKKFFPRHTINTYF